MAHTPSAKKRLRQNKKLRVRNKSEKSLIKTVEKRLEKAIQDGSLRSASEEMSALQKHLDKAAQRRIVPRNTADRMKSRLAGKVEELRKKEASRT